MRKHTSYFSKIGRRMLIVACPVEKVDDQDSRGMEQPKKAGDRDQLIFLLLNNKRMKHRKQRMKTTRTRAYTSNRIGRSKSQSKSLVKE